MASTPNFTQQARATGEHSLEEVDGTIDDLKLAVVENLENRGILSRLKAQARAEIFKTLEGPPDNVLAPAVSNDNLLINELVREYLSYNGYSNALSVFMVESGQPINKALSRDFMKEELGLTERRGDGDHGRYPLLYGILHALKRRGGGYSGVGSGEDYDNGKGSITITSPRDGGGRPASSTGFENDISDIRTIGKEDPAPILFEKRGGTSTHT